MSFNIQLPKNIEHIITNGSFKLSKVESGFKNMCVLSYVHDNMKLVIRFFPRSLIDCTFLYKDDVKFVVNSHLRNRVNNIPASRQLDEYTISESINQLFILIREYKFQNIFS